MEVYVEGQPTPAPTPTAGQPQPVDGLLGEILAMLVEIRDQMDRQYDRQFSAALEVEDAASAADRAYQLVRDLADRLVEAGFDGLARTMLELII